MKTLPRAPAGLSTAVVLTQLGFGGAERQTYELLRGLVGTDWQPSVVICLSEQLEPYGPKIEELGYELVVIPRKGSFDFGRLRALKRELVSRKIRFVHAVHILASGYTHLATRKTDITVMPSVRGTVINPGWLKSRVYRAMFRRARFSLVNSQRGADFIAEKFDVDPAKLRVIPNGIDVSLLDGERGALRQELGLDSSNQQTLIGFVGKDSKTKNVPLLLETAAQLISERQRESKGARETKGERSREIHLALVGVGLDESLRETVPDSIPEGRVHLLGPRPQASALMRDFDLLLLTSRTEGCPNVVLEALLSGTPVVATDVGDVREMTGPEWVARSGTAGELALLAEQRLARGRLAEAEVAELRQRYSIEGMVQRTVELWRDVLYSTSY